MSQLFKLLPRENGKFDIKDEKDEKEDDEDDSKW